LAGIEGNEMYRIREHFVYACLFVALLLPSADAAPTDDALLRTINHIRHILLVVCSTLLRVCELLKSGVRAVVGGAVAGNSRGWGAGTVSVAHPAPARMTTSNAALKRLRGHIIAE